MARFAFSISASLSAASLALVLTATGPARALDDDGKKNIFSSVGELFTFGGEAPGESIQFRDRAPLVIPPNLQQLPRPQAAGPDDGWMHDRKASGRRDLRTAARTGDKERPTLAVPPNDYFRKVGSKPVPHDDTQSLFSLNRLNPFSKSDD